VASICAIKEGDFVVNRAMKLAVIGRGLIGAAAARHLCKMGHDVALVGPDEPADFAHHNGVFGSHYDEGRITRTFDTNPFWRQVNRAAISRYGDISAESGVEFYREVGVLHVGPGASKEIASFAENAAEAGILWEAYDDAGLAERFPFLGFTAGMQGYFEPQNAGYISPRRLVRAQTIAAEELPETTKRCFEGFVADIQSFCCTPFKNLMQDATGHVFRRFDS
jgi:sarcosine oxidase